MRIPSQSLSDKTYDLVIIGGGIFGACAAWDASLRGLSVALLEKGDFSQATSGNHLKMIHGGIRYLQHLDVPRIRESSRERSALLRVSPHLSYPVPIAFPTYGHGIRGKEFLGAGFLLYDLLTWDRNRGLSDPGRRIPPGRFLSREETVGLFPGIREEGLTGAAVFHDGQMYNPPRLALSFIRSAVERGADAGNYLEVTGFLGNGRRVRGVRVADALSGDRFDVRGNIVLNAAGPWAADLLEKTMGVRFLPKPVFSRDLGLVVPRAFSHGYGFACQIDSRDDDAVLSRGGRHIFVMPWRGHALLGSWHVVYEDSPDEIVVTDEELERCVADINKSYPGLPLSPDDITMVNTGLTLFAESASGGGDLRFGKRSLLIDHGRTHGIEGLVTLIGVRATTARGMAEQAVNLVFRKAGKEPKGASTADTPIYGGEIERFDSFLDGACRDNPHGIRPDAIRSLVFNYGSRHRDVLRYIDEHPGWAEPVGTSTVLKAEVVHAVREEMARTLSDVLFRRTDLGTGGDPGREAISECASLLAAELGWTEHRIREEIGRVEAVFRQRGRVKIYSREEAEGTKAGTG